MSSDSLRNTKFKIVALEIHNLLIIFSAGKQCSGMRWKEESEEVEVETVERRRTPRIGEIPR